jgi:hypothetical protein
MPTLVAHSNLASWQGNPPAAVHGTYERSSWGANFCVFVPWVMGHVARAVEACHTFAAQGPSSRLQGLKAPLGAERHRHCTSRTNG